MNKILAVAVAYHPEPEMFRDSVNSFFKLIDHLIIWENTPVADTEIFDASYNPKISYANSGGVNAGISKAFNYAWHYARQHGYDYLLTMDQDSVWEGFDVFLKNTVFNSAAPKGLWGPWRNTSVKHSPTFEPTADLINSGMLIPVDVIDKIGGWDERFFVEGVDLEFCFHAIEIGIRVNYVNGCVLHQRFGEPEVKHLFGKTFSVTNRPVKRIYYIYRNLLLACRKHPKVRPYQKPFLRFRYSQVKFILLGEQNRIRKFLAIFFGTIVGLLKPIK